jgi:CelD/BcsL family acetyltransferase involved in cellulose biosynthesis
MLVSSTRCCIRIFDSAEAMLQLRPLWADLCAAPHYTIFQDFELNQLAARVFSSREQPVIVRAETSYGAAIVPAAVRRDGSLVLLGEELLDYRCFLHRGDREVLRAAVAELAQLGRPLEIKAVHEAQAPFFNNHLPLLPFCSAPVVSLAHTSADHFAAAHLRLARNLRRLARLGFTVRRYRGDYPGLVRFIYRKKAAQNPGNLFQDPLRIEFMVHAASLLPERFEIFTLEDEASIAAAVVMLRENDCRRFYTGWFSPELEKHSPALSLIYEVTRQSLAEGLDCDYMTGEQPYKLRLATGSMPLYRVQATAEQLAAFAQAPAAELSQTA